MSDLPLEIMVKIALVDVNSYRAMLALPPMARYFHKNPSATDLFIRREENGSRKIWYKGHKIHRDNDNPAIITDRVQIWVKHGKLHRDGSCPAVYSKDGYFTIWAKNGVPHRENDMPAFINGRVQIYYKNGSIHREGNKCAVINPDGASFRVLNLTAANRQTFNIKYVNPTEYDVTDMSLTMLAKRLSDNIYWIRLHNILHGRYYEGLPHSDNGPAIHSKGDKYVWYKHGKEHSHEGKPSTVSPLLRVWCTNGELHRQDGPAILTPDGEFWFTNSQRDRKDGLPACVYGNGKREYWVDGKRHRVDGPAIVYANGGMEYWVNGLRHRVDGPAVICKNGRIEYYVNGKLHRDNGPARINSNGSGEFYRHGKRVHN